MNGANVENTGKYAVAGRNEEIIHLCERNHSIFEDVSETAIEFHQNDVFKYIYENKLKKIDDMQKLGEKCIMFYNFEILSFLRENSLKIDKNLIINSIESGNIFVLQYFYQINPIQARNIHTNEIVAIKTIKLKHLNRTEKSKALKEAQLLSKLHHPNIVSYKESWTKNEKLYIVMEYIEGGDLGKVIKKRHGTLFRESEVLHYFVQLVSVIDYIHSNHILHRDLKPDNIFVTKTNMIKLGDFGVARSLDNTFDMANTVIGTPYYLSPEIWEGKPYDSHSDIYSLGVILYELCALKKPYEAPNALALCSIVTKGEHEDIPNIYSDDLKNLVNRMLSLDPHQRPTAREIKQMKIITKGAINIINKNQTIISKQINSPKRKRLLNLNLMNNTNANEQENIPFNDFIDEDDENEEEEMVIEDDFIEDDFIKEEEEEEEEMDEEQLFLLQETSNALRQSIIISPMK